MKNKPEFIKIDYDTWRSITHNTIFNVNFILNTVKDLIDKNIAENNKVLFEHPYVAAGLYTFAIEEYGKFLYLNSLEEQNGKFTIKYREKFRNHEKKIQRALDNLPEECKMVHFGGYTSSGFTKTGFNTDVIANFETRLGIFYSDFADDETIQNVPQVDVKSLSKAYESFKDIAEDTLEKFNLKHHSKPNH